MVGIDEKTRGVERDWIAFFGFRRFWHVHFQAMRQRSGLVRKETGHNDEHLAIVSQVNGLINRALPHFV